MLYISLVTLLGQLSSFLVHLFDGFCSLERFFHLKFEHAARSMTNLVYSVGMGTVSPSTAPLTHSCSDLISNAFTSTLKARTRKRGHCSESPTGVPAAGMGVTIKFADLCPKVYTGTSYSEHGRLSAMFEDQVVAVDGMQWIRQVCPRDARIILQVHPHASGYICV